MMDPYRLKAFLQKLAYLIYLQRGHRVDGLSVVFDMEGVSTKMLWRPGKKPTLSLTNEILNQVNVVH